MQVQQAVRFRYRPSQFAQRVELRGEMAHWAEPLEMSLRQGGVFERTVSLEPGVYAYKFRHDDGSWHLDPGNPRTVSDRGQRNSVLVVGGTAEPLLHAPSSPFLSLDARGLLRVRASLRRSADSCNGHLPHGVLDHEGSEASLSPGRTAQSSCLTLVYDEGHGDVRATLFPKFADDEHVHYEVVIPFSTRSLQYHFELSDGASHTDAPLIGQGEAYPIRPFVVKAAEVTSAVPVTFRDGVIYTVILDRFRRASGPLDVSIDDERGRMGGDLAGVTASLDYLLGLGVTHLHLSPMALSPSAHRYDVVDPRVVDPSLGSEADLRTLLQSAHAKGMKVIADLTVTHVHRDFFAFKDVAERGEASPYWDWFYCYRFPFFDGEDPGYRHYQKGQWHLPFLRLEHPEVQSYILETFAHWAELGVDGFRIDSAAEVPLSLVSRIRDLTSQRAPGSIVFGELIVEHGHRWTGAGAHAVTDFSLQEGMVRWLERGGDPLEHFVGRAVRRSLSRTHAAQAIAFTATHDQTRLATRTQSTRMAQLGLFWLLTQEAVPALLYGEELALRSEAKDREFEDVWPDRMGLVWRDGHPSGDDETRVLTRSLIAARHEHEVLRRGEQHALETGHLDVAAYRRRHGEKTVDVFLHRGEGEVVVPLPPGAHRGGRILQHLGAAELTRTDDAVTLRLGPKSAALIVRERPADLQTTLTSLVSDNSAHAEMAYLEGETVVAAYPKRLYLTVTERCNLKCVHCITHAPALTESGRARQMMPWVFDAMNDALLAAEYFGFVHGGESLVSPHFFPLLAHIQKLKEGRSYDVHLLSNGMALRPKVVDRLIEHGVTSLSVSLDGLSPEVNDGLRVLGRVDTILEHLAFVVHRREAIGAELRLGVSTVVTRASLPELPVLARRLRGLGVDWLKLEEVAVVNSACRGLSPEPNAIAPILEEVKAIARAEGLKLVDHLHGHGACACHDEGARAFRDADDFANRTEFRPCRMLWEQAAIDADGVLRPVDYDRPRTGSLLEHTFLELWNHETVQGQRARVLASQSREHRARCLASP